MTQSRHAKMMARFADNKKALEAVLKQQAEPVAWVVYGNVSDEKHAVDYQQEDIDAISVGTMLYTAPPQRKLLTDFNARGILASKLTCWHRLTEEETNELVKLFIDHALDAHGIKEGT